MVVVPEEEESFNHKRPLPSDLLLKIPELFSYHKCYHILLLLYYPTDICLGLADICIVLSILPWRIAS